MIAVRQCLKGLADTGLRFAMPPGPGIGIGRNAEMEGFEPSRSDLARFVQTGLNFFDLICRVSLCEGPAEVYATPRVPLSHRHFVGQTKRLAGGRLYLLRPSQPDIYDGCAVAQAQAGRDWMIEFSHPAPIGLDRRSRLVGQAKVPEDPCLVVRCSSTGVMPKAIAKIAMDCPMVTLDRFVRECKRLLEAALKEPFQREHSPSDESRPVLGLCFGKGRKALGKFTRSCGGDMVAGPSPKDCREL